MYKNIDIQYSAHLIVLFYLFGLRRYLCFQTCMQSFIDLWMNHTKIAKFPHSLCPHLVLECLIALNFSNGSRRGHTIVGLTTTYAIIADHHRRCDFESRSCGGVLDTTLS